MLSASRSVIRTGVMAAVALAIVRPPVALASRPATTVVAHVSHALRPSRVEIGAGRYVSGGGRGGRVQRAPRPAPPPATRSARPPCDGCVLVASHDGRRRAPHLRATSPVARLGRIPPMRVVDIVHGRRVSLPAALFYDAHAPPLPVTDVAGLLA
jgi:hypothetical protein